MKYDIIIIGAGVAGLTASIYSRQANKSVLIVENNVVGGTVATLEKITNYPGFNEISGMELVQNIYIQAINLGVEFLFDNIKLIDFKNKNIHVRDITYEYGALIIANGTSYKKLNAINEEKFFQKGISYCAVCDGNLYKNKKVIVITNNSTGKSAIDYLSNLTNDLIVLNLGNENITYPNSINKVNDISFDGDIRLKSITYSVNGNTEKIDCDGCFIALGKEIDTSLYKDKIDLENNFVKSDERMHTNIEGVFVAGDIRNTPLRQIVTACADGAIASGEAIKYISSL